MRLVCPTLKSLNLSGRNEIRRQALEHPHVNFLKEI